MEAFEDLANGYLYTVEGWSQKDVCLYNADIAEKAGVPQISQVRRKRCKLFEQRLACSEGT